LRFGLRGLAAKCSTLNADEDPSMVLRLAEVIDRPVGMKCARAAPARWDRGLLEQVASRSSGWRPLRSADIAAWPYESEGWPGRAYGALRKANRSAAADDACAYQSECRPGGPYGALEKDRDPP